MRNVTIEELLSDGMRSMELKDFATAEKCFLTILHRYSKTGDDYMAALGARDSLSMLYSRGLAPDRERALLFLRTLSPVDKVAAKFFAYAQMDGVFGEPDYKGALQNLSTCFADDQLYPLGYLLANGYGVKKDLAKAVCLLKAAQLALDNRADALLDSLKLEADFKIDEESHSSIKKKSRMLISELYKESGIVPVASVASVDDVIRKLFADKSVKELVSPKSSFSSFVTGTIKIGSSKAVKPSADLSRGNNSVDSANREFSYQIHNLGRIYAHASFSPVFKPHTRYCVNTFANATPYIAYGDIMDNKYIIRARPLEVMNTFDDEKREVIVEYASLEELVKDGWRLD